MAARRELGRVRRLVVKVGSGLITTPRVGVDEKRLDALAADIAAARRDREVVLVTSGAIVAGMARLALAERPRTIPEKQAAAAVGQAALMWHYEIAFGRHDIRVGQVLLTAQDIRDRGRYRNARNTLRIVNENDTVAVDEIKVGDNDNLSAFVASLVSADLLVLLTDVDGLYTADPAATPGAHKIDTVESITEDILRLVWDRAGRVSIGGMATKLEAAKKATASGIPMVIASGREEGVLGRLLAGEPVGTYFPAKPDALGARKQWIAFAVPPRGRLIVDAGALRALRDDGRSLLPSGVVEVEGEFSVGDVVAVVAQADGRELGRGLVNFDAAELRKIRGAKTGQIEERLGYRGADEVIHRDNLVIL
jgi:glutamate 5-kinase